MTPAYSISVDGNAINFGGRLISIQVTDESPDRYVAETSDTLEIVLDDTLPSRLALPQRGRALSVSLGYKETGLVALQTFIVDEVEILGPPDRMIIRAQTNPKSSADQAYASFATHKSRTFPTGSTIQAVVAQIAKDHSMTGVVSASLASIQLPQINQVDSPDMDVLWDIALTHDAVVKIIGGKLTLLDRGIGMSATGQQLQQVTVTRAQPGQALDPKANYLTSWRCRFSDFIQYATAIARYYDLDKAKYVEVTAGSGAEPILRLTNTSPNASEAQAAAAAALAACDRRTAEVTLGMPGNAAIVAEGTVTVQGIRDGIDDTWCVMKVIHTIDHDGFRTEINANRLSSDALEEADADEDD
jgi:hypothetical protein